MRFSPIKISWNFLRHYFLNHILGKPGSVAAARDQLRLCSSQKVISLSSLCVLCQAKNHHHLSVSTCNIQYRRFNPTLIDKYINYDQPFHCAGSIQLETNGFMLIESLKSDDPFSIYGLPMLTLISQLTELGYSLPSLLKPLAWHHQKQTHPYRFLILITRQSHASPDKVRNFQKAYYILYHYTRLL